MWIAPFFIYRKTILAGHICERSEHIWPATLYELSEHHLLLTNTTSPLISRWQHLSVGTVWTAVKYERKTTNFGRGGFYIRPSAIHKIMVIFNVCFLFRKNVISATVEYFYRYSVFLSCLSVVPLCENFAHLCSLVFTFISHSCSYWVEAYLCERSEHR